MKAFPYFYRHPTSGLSVTSDGMDLRDYFAAQAMQALIQSKPNEFVAHIAFMYADEMMKEREKQDE
jgi:hypothetical protein